jgi:hypothetical protein
MPNNGSTFRAYTRIPIGLKWKQIRTTTGYVKRDPNDTLEKAKALHVEGPTERAQKPELKFLNIMVIQRKH